MKRWSYLCVILLCSKKRKELGRAKWIPMAVFLASRYLNISSCGSVWSAGIVSTGSLALPYCSAKRRLSVSSYGCRYWCNFFCVQLYTDNSRHIPGFCMITSLVNIHKIFSRLDVTSYLTCSHHCFSRQTLWFVPDPVLFVTSDPPVTCVLKFITILFADLPSILLRRLPKCKWILLFSWKCSTTSLFAWSVTLQGAHGFRRGSSFLLPVTRQRIEGSGCGKFVMQN